MSIFAQWEKKPINNILGVYIQDKEEFEKDEHEILEEKRMDTTYINMDMDRKYWKCYVVDLGSGDKGIVLVFDKKQKEADKGIEE